MKKEPTENIDLVSRKEPLKKTGKYAALTAVGSFIILSPNTVSYTHLTLPTTPYV